MPERSQPLLLARVAKGVPRPQQDVAVVSSKCPVQMTVFICSLISTACEAMHAHHDETNQPKGKVLGVITHFEE